MVCTRVVYFDGYVITYQIEVTSANEFFKVGSTIKTEREIEFEGKMYPYVTLDISSKSHPYYTGKQKTFDNEGSAARFQKRFGHFIGVKRG